MASAHFVNFLSTKYVTIAETMAMLNPLTTAGVEVDTTDGVGLVFLVVVFIGRLYHQRIIASVVCLLI